jgi:hypothetical protein
LLQQIGKCIAVFQESLITDEPKLRSECLFARSHV